jgi:hypothetical protein
MVSDEPRSGEEAQPQREEDRPRALKKEKSRWRENSPLKEEKSRWRQDKPLKKEKSRWRHNSALKKEQWD